MRELLLQLEILLEDNRNPILQDLDHGSFVEDDFNLVTSNLGMKPTNSLLELYRWKSGIEAIKVLTSGYPCQLCSMGTHIEFRATSSLLILDQNTSKNFGKKYLPIIYNGILEDPILIDLKADSNTYGQLFYYSPNVTQSAEPMSIYDSLECWIETVCMCYKKGIYKILPDGKLFSDTEAEFEISAKFNPRSDFWRS